MKLIHNFVLKSIKYLNMLLSHFKHCTLFELLIVIEKNNKILKYLIWLNVLLCKYY